MIAEAEILRVLQGRYSLVGETREVRQGLCQTNVQVRLLDASEASFPSNGRSKVLVKKEVISSMLCLSNVSFRPTYVWHCL